MGRCHTHLPRRKKRMSETLKVFILFTTTFIFSITSAVGMMAGVVYVYYLGGKVGVLEMLILLALIFIPPTITYNIGKWIINKLPDDKEPYYVN